MFGDPPIALPLRRCGRRWHDPDPWHSDTPPGGSSCPCRLYRKGRSVYTCVYQSPRVYVFVDVWSVAFPKFSKLVLYKDFVFFNHFVFSKKGQDDTELILWEGWKWRHEFHQWSTVHLDPPSVPRAPLTSPPRRRLLRRHVTPSPSRETRYQPSWPGAVWDVFDVET